MLKQHPFKRGPLEDIVRLNLSSILLVEPDPDLRNSRRLLLATLRHPVLAVSCYKDVCDLPIASNCALVAINLVQNENESLRIAAYTRRTWPNAKILVLGDPSENFDDPLYDDAVNPRYNPAGMIEAAYTLLRERSSDPGGKANS